MFRPFASLSALLPALLIAFLTLQSPAAQVIPPIKPLTPGQFGVHMHLFWDSASPDDIRNAANIGVRVIRTDFSWKDTEPTAGTYNWKQYDDLVAKLRTYGIRPMFVLSKTNPAYLEYAERSWSPRTYRSQQAFSKWAAAAALRYQKYDPIWEIWNEPDNERFWLPAPNADEYLTMANSTCATMRAVAPYATIIGPGLSVIPSLDNRWHSAGFMQSLFQSAPLSTCLSAISVHPYRNNKIPETYIDEIPGVRGVFKAQQPRGTMPPVLVSEWGYSSFDPYTLNNELQAAYAVRQQLVSILLEQPMSILYDWRNDGADTSSKENSFGMLTIKDEQKPVFKAMNIFANQLNSYQYIGRLASNKDIFALAFSNRTLANNYRYAVWSTTKDQSYFISFPAGAASSRWQVNAINIYGKVLTTKLQTGGVTVPIDVGPVYVTISLKP